MMSGCCFWKELLGARTLQLAANSDVGIPYPLTAAERVRSISRPALDGWKSSHREPITIALP
jgi:hypothetical protein